MKKGGKYKKEKLENLKLGEISRLHVFKRKLHELHVTGSANISFKIALISQVTLKTQSGTEECINGLEEEISVVLFHEYVVYGCTVLYGIPRVYPALNGFVHQIYLRISCFPNEVA